MRNSTDKPLWKSFDAPVDFEIYYYYYNYFLALFQVRIFTTRSNVLVNNPKILNPSNEVRVVASKAAGRTSWVNFAPLRWPDPPTTRTIKWVPVHELPTVYPCLVLPLASRLRLGMPASVDEPRLAV